MPIERPQARRNREQILRVAGEALTHREPAAPPLREIARRAGLGRSTVYRYFPDRHELADAVVSRKLADLRREIQVVLAGRRTLRDLLTWVFSTQAEMRPLVGLIRELPVEAQQRYAGLMLRALTPAVEHGRATGVLREGVEPHDLIAVFAMLEGLTRDTPPALLDETGRERMIDVVLDGLFAR